MIRTTTMLAAALILAAPAFAQAPQATPGATQDAPRPVPPQAFRTPEEGFAALVAALQARSDRQIQRVIGSENMPLIRDADAAARQRARERFLAAHAEKAEVVRTAPDRAVLQVGNDGFPLALPLVQRGGLWRFESAAARQEVIDRRIGRNELDTIETLRAIGDAQDEYARDAGRQGAFRAYARRFFSTPGQRDGLFWPTAQGEPPSPLGPFVAVASAGGYAPRREGDAPQPFHGYLFRILERQGPDAPGGAFDYVVNGRMIGGWAVIATPYRHGSTGIMTFMISHHGDVWQANLGPDTARLAAGITAFNPGPGWEKVAE
ncbi:DUF2950 domain-containing protein [Falsiroseomonas oryziterrae]|uniref:DUF2950 domain-containing protein n=1 Tax=Falsiroseomonas oryziterrae TaxID=2911368 RepID=UPI001F2F6201|nr:DUF2950 domain-containing protein [Roseomonas sp. NPKOSM-4]